MNELRVALVACALALAPAALADHPLTPFPSGMTPPSSAPASAFAPGFINGTCGQTGAVAVFSAASTLTCYNVFAGTYGLSVAPTVLAADDVPLSVCDPTGMTCGFGVVAADALGDFGMHMDESVTAPTKGTGSAYLYNDSTLHRLLLSNNNGSYFTVVTTGEQETFTSTAWTFTNDMAVTLSGGVNGINFDSNTLSIDGTNNRVGIGTAAPSVDLHVIGATSGRIEADGTGTANFGQVIAENSIAEGLAIWIAEYGSTFATSGASQSSSGQLRSAGALNLLSVAAVSPSIRFWTNTAGDVEQMTIIPASTTINNNTILGDASGDTVTSNAAAWTFVNDTAVTLSGGVNGINFDSNTLSIDATNNRVGVLTAAPTFPFDVNGAGGAAQIKSTTAAGAGVIRVAQDNGATVLDIDAFGSTFVGAGCETANNVCLTTNATSSNGKLGLQSFNASNPEIDFFTAVGLDATVGILRMSITETSTSINNNTVLGDASGDTVTSNAAAWTFVNDTAVTLSGGVNGINFDSNTLSIDATNDFVGIGTAAPSYKLHVKAAGTIMAAETSSTTAGVLVRVQNDQSNVLDLNMGASAQGGSGGALQASTALITTNLGVMNIQGWSATPEIAFWTNSGAAVTTGTRRMRILETEAVVNDDSNNYDFRVESDGNANAIFVDASADKVGILTASPTFTLDVTGEIRSSVHINVTGTTPTIDGASTCTSTGIVGNDQRGVVTGDCTIGQTIIVDFATTWAATPRCVFVERDVAATGDVMYGVETTTQWTLTASTGAGTGTGTYTYICMG